MAVIAAAPNGKEALACFRLHRPDITLMDIRMPKMNSVEAIGAIRKEFPSARIIALTTASGNISYHKNRFHAKSREE
jgi:YesN/AraC family two-component response regulator